MTTGPIYFKYPLLPRPSRPFHMALGVVLFLLLAQLVASAQGQLDRPISLKAKDVTAAQALGLLAKQGKVSLAYSEHFFDSHQKITLNAKNQPLRDVLEKILDGTGVGFKELNGQVVLFMKQAPELRQLTISGFVEDAQSGERLIAATVYCPEVGQGTITNEYGFYSLSLPHAAAHLYFSYIGYGEAKVRLGQLPQQRINQPLEPAMMLSEIVVTPLSDSAKSSLLPSPGNMQRFKPEDFKAAPDLGGQSDLMRIMQMLPGMQTGADGISGLFVRGGNSDQNLVLLDGVPVYNPDHLLGMFSIFNTSAIRSAKLLKGGIPARYGGRASSVIDVYTKEGSNQRWGGEAEADLIGAKAMLEGPFAKKKGSLMLSGRHSHSDFYLLPTVVKLLAADDLDSPNYAFYDFNAKASYRFSDKDKLHLSFYKGNDGFKAEDVFQDSFSEDKTTFKFDWGNTISSLRWNHVFNHKLFSNTSVNLSYFRFLLGFLSQFSYAPEPGEEPTSFTVFLGVKSEIRDFAWKTDFDYAFSERHYLRFGLGVANHRFSPNLSFFENNSATTDSLSIEDYLEIGQSIVKKANSFDAYIEDEWLPSKNLSLNIGLRLAGFHSGDKAYLLPEPRLNAAYQIGKRHKLAASLTRHVQYVHRTNPVGYNFPSDYWTPSNHRVAPQKVWQGTIGLEGNLPKGFSYSVEAYQKSMTGLLAFPDSVFFDPLLSEGDPEDFFISIDGKAMGMEFLLRKEEGRVGGWLGYALAKSTRQSDQVNYGRTFNFLFDRRHELKLYAYVRMGQRWVASANWIYGSPNPRVTDEGPVEAPPGEVNSIRSSANHRLDLSLLYTIKKGRWEQRLKASVYNAYNRKNVAFYSYKYDINGNYSLEPVHLFGIRPGVSYEVKF
ncbi:MAG: TonB-dependent receptor plug domain-containing protein [Saprospiraceae bacterium]|nr:TonB-dependent receptor plug domain-containing protein [Saprospiraceae bacterium]